MEIIFKYTYNGSTVYRNPVLIMFDGDYDDTEFPELKTRPIGATAGYNFPVVFEEPKRETINVNGVEYYRDLGRVEKPYSPTLDRPGMSVRRLKNNDWRLEMPELEFYVETDSLADLLALRNGSGLLVFNHHTGMLKEIWNMFEIVSNGVHIYLTAAITDDELGF